MPNLTDKVALITGAGSGIGAAVAKHFAALGCWLALNDFREESLENTAKHCIKAGLPKDKIVTIPGDITAKGVPELLVSKTVEFFGKMDVLLNIAGQAKLVPFLKTTEADFDDIMNVNCKATFRLIQLSAPHLKKTKGNVVNVSSVASSRPGENTSAYNISKSAVDQITCSAAIELAPDVRVNSINPGPVRTNILAHMGLPQEAVNKMYDNMNKCTLLNRACSPEEIAFAFAFLASDDASFITGINLPVDGGFRIVPLKFDF